MSQQDRSSIRSDEHAARDTVIESNGVSVKFGMGRGTSTVLDNASLDIYSGEILGVVGESGSGKSMFASALLDAVVEPGVVSGDITYHNENGDDIDILGLSDEELRRLRWEDISMVFQGAMSSFNPTMRIRGHFKETLKAHDYDVAEGMERAEQLLRDLYLDPERVLASYPHELSGGMSQRALIALSLILEPNLLVMDEPTAALDLLMQRTILQLLEDIQERYDLTIVFITHDLPLVASLADRLAVMYAFHFVEKGPTERIIESPKHPYTRALLRSVPNLDMSLSQMQPVEGSSPDPVNPPAGCSYHPRCPLADKTCQTQDPAFQSVGENHTAACHHWEDSAETIPLSFEDEGDTQSSSTTGVGRGSADAVVSLTDVDVEFEQQGGLLSMFDDPEVVRAVDDVSLDIYENDVVSLVGESGCGKTTLGKTSIGVRRPTDGSVAYRGQDIWNARDFSEEISIPYETIRQQLQIIHQDPGSSLNPNRTVKSSLVKPLDQYQPDLTDEDREALIFGMLKHVGMTPPDDYADRYPHQLSGGEKQRVSLVRALLMNPDLVLADEAVSALDVSLRVEMMDLMLELQQQVGTSYLFISHNIANARYLSEYADGRIGVMYMGEVVEIAPAKELLDDPQHPYTKALMWATPDINAEDEESEAPIRDVDIPDPIDPPSGCKFHTRCPKARETCVHNAPSIEDDGPGDHGTACFRAYDHDHPYWESDPIEEDGPTHGETNN
ncbi:oligopeptide/dipeptide ABC transporter, ATPase subunit [Halococcus morrhuae DSM 1307]|uniref:Oligopeptide/dipeptide ABC transporter, ATPase subunit n=1 Tax=Halococcus morrhuae DSM 1307 TaxID=931277 RepID=M0MN98_HALMO|nr:ABC transporter ATP-binding protein [Halococcus morrhuae]EMA46848.1 oligopeptide/dipeptide ABC transporter, ATPase subunit [Halococcus morrhuae DSM 1307]